MNKKHLAHHARRIFLLVVFLLEKHEVNEEDSSQEGSLDFDVQVDGEGQAEVVRISEGFLDEAGPLLGDHAHLTAAVRTEDFELDVGAEAAPSADGAFDFQDAVATVIPYRVAGVEHRPVLLQGPYGGPRWALDLCILVVSGGSGTQF